jgi:hypothetical protein
MSNMMKYAIIAGFCSAGACIIAPVNAQVARSRAVIAPTGPVKPATISQVRPLTQDEMKARMKTPPRYLSATELKARMPGSVAASTVPDLKSSFSLTPAVQTVGGRGSIIIEGDVMVPNPLPAGFPGQATIRYQLIGLGSASWNGGVRLSLNAQKGVFYAVDCLTSITTTETPNVYFSISGSDASQSGAMAVNNGHVVFNVRRTADNGDIKIYFRPDKYEQFKNYAGQMVEQNIMDFWGCQISTGS